MTVLGKDREGGKEGGGGGGEGGRKVCREDGLGKKKNLEETNQVNGQTWKNLIIKYIRIKKEPNHRVH